jgi:uncharacterized protein YbbC (DUF1343 family)
MRAFICCLWLAGILRLVPLAEAQVQLGSEALAANGFKELLGKRLALITNPSGANRQSQSTMDVLRKAKGVKLVALFAPEHGLRGNLPAGKEFPDAVDEGTGLPVYSLYGPGPTRQPTAKMLKDIDAVIYDIQDTGCRSYTFISTMGLAMEACGEAGIEFIVLDRPNPVGGDRVEGPLVEKRFRSFVSQWDVPYVYGLTCGELARMINGERWIKKPCPLTVVPMKGWRRSMIWRDTGLPWVPTSPNIPRSNSPLYYAASGLFGEIAGGSGINIGNVFHRPFECVTANWLDAPALSRQMNGYGLPGVKFPALSIPHHGRQFQAVQWDFTDPAHAPLVAINLYLLEAVRRVAGRDLLSEAMTAKKNFGFLDKVVGTDEVRKSLRSGKSAFSVVNAWKTGEETFRKKRQKYLLY